MKKFRKFVVNQFDVIIKLYNDSFDQYSELYQGNQNLQALNIQI